MLVFCGKTTGGFVLAFVDRRGRGCEAAGAVSVLLPFGVSVLLYTGEGERERDQRERMRSRERESQSVKAWFSNERFHSQVERRLNRTQRDPEYRWIFFP